MLMVVADNSEVIALKHLAVSKPPLPLTLKPGVEYQI